jgi:hypothetical protein
MTSCIGEIADEGLSMETRRDFLRLASASLAALLIGGVGQARAQPEPSLIVQLEALCRRLAPLGWQRMMLAVTGGELDITAPDLARELAKPVAIDRTYPGFGDFALAGNRGIEPGRPDESLLYHALAAPTVVSVPPEARWAAFRRSQRSRLSKTTFTPPVLPRWTRSVRPRTACRLPLRRSRCITATRLIRSAASMRNSASPAPE